MEKLKTDWIDDVLVILHTGLGTTAVIFGIFCFLTGCGAAPTEQTPGQTGTGTVTSTETTPGPPKDPSEEPKEKAPEEPATLPENMPEAYKALTKDQSMRLMVRLGFDRMLAKDQVFFAEHYQSYYIRGEEGTMGYPDSSYVPANTKALINPLSCPLGFKQTGQIDLSIGISEGLFDKLPPESQWVWTSWKSYSDAYSALVTSDFTDQWGFSFIGHMFYPKHAKRIVGRMYCFMSVSDLPNIDDISDDYKRLYNGN